MNVTKKSGSFHEFHLFYIVATHGLLSRIVPFRSGINFLPVFVTLFQKVIPCTIYYIIILQVFLFYKNFIIILTSIFMRYK